MRRIVQYVSGVIKKYTSPVFVGLLLLSFALWYVTKLSYTYTTELPMPIRVGESNFKVKCVVEGTGYRLFAHRFFFNSALKLVPDALQMTPSVINKGYYVINPFSLQNAISLQNGDIRIISVGELPEITLEGEVK